MSRHMVLALWILAYLHAQSTEAIFRSLFATALQRFREITWDPEGYTYNVPTGRLYREYDFIVVGAGSGGATVTNRLTEVRDWTVLLLEAGGDEQFIQDIPLLMSHIQLTSYSWGYKAQPQDNACLGLKDRRSVWPFGKGMGGTSTLNGMMYTRGHRRDYDAWAQMGNSGWSYEEVLPYFIKSENAKGEFMNNADYHGRGGYLDVQNLPYTSPLLHAFLESAPELGYSRNIDYHGESMIGFSRIQTTTRDGSRCSANKAFLRPIRYRENLNVAKYAHVTKILIDPNSKQAYGVEFYRNGHFWQIFARKEVILSAGAVNTPQLLMLSGIGPRAHLQSFKIPVLHDAPGVGQNLQDHITMPGLSFVVNETVSVVENRLVFDVRTFFDYLAYGKGMLTLIGGVEGIAYIRTESATTPPDFPNIELIFASASLAADDGRVVRKVVGMTDEIYNAVYKPINNKDAWTIWPMLVESNARGWVKLQSKNPLTRPIMIGNYLEDEADVATLAEGIRYAVRVSQTAAFQRFNSTLNPNPLPACRYLEFNTDRYWRCVVRQLTTTLHHFCGTTKMGPGSDPMAVVDPELRVYGVSGLRVVDTSIIPLIPVAHTNAPAFMIGEKAGDLIKATYGKLDINSINFI